ncbi:P-loop containing nucleoside triphosphate hydrolases superfamily protein [Euphorbia peplus]|nr:P-loop containing nucleoside triphosphate hydrolases superfamily protein [Euphorbia peplus]
MILIPNILLLVFPTIIIFFLLKFLSKTCFLHIILTWWRSFEDLFHVHQYYKVPQFNENFQPNHLYCKISTYLTSLPAMEDSDFTNLFSGPKSNDIILRLDDKQLVHDSILGATVSWSNQKSDDGDSNLVLKLRKKDKKRILKPYLQHILAAADEIEQRNKEIKLYMNLETENGRRWRSGVPFTHPATMDTVVMDGEVKNKVKTDLESFIKSKQYYHRLGRVHKRSYLLYGGYGTGKSSFVAAMARFLKYDVYEIDLSKVRDDSDLKTLLLQTTSRSMIVIEDLDMFLAEKSRLTKRGITNFMDGIISSCGEERVMVFTMNNKIEEDMVMRPGRIDVHIEFKHCNFNGFKTLANTYLGVKEHKLFSQIEEMFESSSLSPAEIGEIMISNRNSPSRALKSVISAMQSNNSKVKMSGGGQRSVSESSSAGESEGAAAGVICRESVHTVREFRKLYGLLKMGSRRKEESPLIDYSSVLDSNKDKEQASRPPAS